MKLNIFELVFTTVMGVCIGVFFWGWTFIHSFIAPPLQIIGLKYLTFGLWMLPGLLIPFIVRKPGTALLASMMAALVEGLLAKWGIMSLLWGFMQGLGAELIFALFLYRRWNILTLSLAALSASCFGFTVDYFYYHFTQFSITFNLIQVVGMVISSQLLGMLPVLYLSRTLLKAGLLNQFKIVSDSTNA